MRAARTLVLAVCALAGTAHAGGPTGEVTGYVFDPSGTPIRGVTVTAARKPPEVGQKKTTSNDQGYFRLTGLPPGRYDVSASAPKLKTAVQPDVDLAAGPAAEVHLVMEVARPVEDVRVVERPPGTPASSGDFDDFIDTLPEGSRPGPPEALLGWRLAPGVDAHFTDNPFLDTRENPRSTFSIDGSTAAYASLRRFIEGGQAPAPGTVQIEEMLDHFRFQYPAPVGDEAMAVSFEVNDCPWNPDTRLVLVGVRGRAMPATAIVARDVRLQVELNPARVAAYRLIGHENRVLRAADFNDDHEDAGELRAGASVTALYEIVPASRPASGRPELLAVEARFKLPGGWFSKKREWSITDGGAHLGQASADFRFAAAVAAFGMILRASPHRGSADHDLVLRLAREALGNDSGGERRGFLEVVERARSLEPPAGVTRR